MEKHTSSLRRLAHGLACSLMLSGRCFCAETNSVVADKQLSLEELHQRFDDTIAQLENSENAKKYPDVENQIIRYAVRTMNAIGKRGDRASLPFLEEKSLSTNTHALIRRATANAYVKIADLDECVEFMRKLYDDPSIQGSWRYFLNKKFLEKVQTEGETLAPETAEKVCSFLLCVVQRVENSGDAHDADRFLLERMPDYANSRQRASLTRFATTGNAWVTNTFHPVKAHFDKIPPSKRVDLRERFPDLPPLPADKGGRPSVPVWIVVGVAVVIGVAALLRFLLRKKHVAP